MLNMIKNILFVSYLKNKGIKRICFILGGLPFILCLVTFFVEGARTPGYVLTGIIAFYVPFLLASAMVWVYRGFKDNISISMSDYLVLINSVEVVLFPQYEFDVSLKQKGYIFSQEIIFMRKIQYWYMLVLEKITRLAIMEVSIKLRKLLFLTIWSLQLLRGHLSIIEKTTMFQNAILHS